MALRPAPKRNSVDYQKLDDLQKEIFGTENSEKDETNAAESLKSKDGVVSERNDSDAKTGSGKTDGKKSSGDERMTKTVTTKAARQQKSSSSRTDSSEKDVAARGDSTATAGVDNRLGRDFKDLETIAAGIVSSKAGQGRNTTRPFSLPRTLIIDTTRLKSKFRTIDEQFTQNVIVDFLLREALALVTPENYKDMRAAAFETVKRAEETTRRSLTVTEEVIYQMSELKAGINLETGRKYSNDEIFSTLLAIGVNRLYRNGVLT